MIFVDLLINLSLLVALTVVSGFVDKRWPRETVNGKILQGALFGLAAVIGMLRPLEMGGGIIIDGRSMMISLCALYFGLPALAVATVLVVLTRIGLGGAGVFTGILSVLMAGTVGLVGRYFHLLQGRIPSTVYLYLFGLVVHILLLVVFLTLPGGLDLIVRVGPAIIFLYPLATMLAGTVLSDQLNAQQQLDALRISEERFRVVSSLTSDCIYSCRRCANGLFRIEWVSGKASAVFGLSNDELKAYNCWQVFVDDEDRELFARAITDLEPGTSSDVVLRINGVDGVRRYVHSVARVVASPSDGGGHVLFGGLQDITPRKQAEAALQLKNQEMEDFVYIVSHDLKSPLVTVTSFLDLLERDIASQNAENIQKDVGFIRGAAVKMQQLLDALLRLSRVGRRDNPPEVFPLQQMVEQCLSALAGAIRQRQIEIEAGPLPMNLRGDRTQLGQIWQNLIENAIKYMGDQDRPCIEIGVREESQGAVFYVRDNGMGIAPEHSERIFSLFAQLNPRSEGSGLGLALVKKIVTRYGGSIWVESAGEGQGSCFCFTLPEGIKTGR